MTYLPLIALLVSSIISDDSLPQQPLSALKGYDLSVVRQDDFIKPKDMITVGAVIDGVHYTGDCRGGTNCDNLVLPSYSIAKSIMGGFALMRLEKLYPGAKDAVLADYVPACKQAGWDKVTFANLLDMASGHYQTQKPYEDEKTVDVFLTKPTNHEKTAFACSQFKKQAKAGTTWVYRTSDTWLLGVAMQRFWQEKQGNTKADFYGDLIQPLWADLGLSDTISTGRGEGRQPFTGTEMFFLRADIAKIGYALATRDTRLVDQLDKQMLDTALQGQPTASGLKTDAPNMAYKYGFWAYNAGAYLGCDADMWVPFMSGYGGKTVLMLPTGDVYYYFSDGHVYRFAEVIAEIHNHRPICSTTAK